MLRFRDFYVKKQGIKFCIGEVNLPKKNNKIFSKLYNDNAQKYLNILNNSNDTNIQKEYDKYNSFFNSKQ